MEIEYLSNMSWEPAIIKVDARESERLDPDSLQQVVDGWLDHRDKYPLCRNGCSRKYRRVSQGSSPAEAVIAVQWVCESCLPSLIRKLGELPSIRRAVIGASAPEAVPLPLSWIDVGARTVTLEGGQSLSVEPFAISHYPISIGEYARFCQCTGYISHAEIRRSADTYRSNVFTTGFDETSVLALSAYFLSWADAEAYCRWSGYRLPTEAEYFAAALLDDAVHALGEQHSLWNRHKDCLLILHDRIITGTRDNGRAVVRSGPWGCKEPGWEGLRDQNRRVAHVNEPVGQFCIVKSRLPTRQV